MCEGLCMLFYFCCQLVREPAYWAFLLCLCASGTCKPEQACCCAPLAPQIENANVMLLQFGQMFPMLPAAAFAGGRVLTLDAFLDAFRPLWPTLRCTMRDVNNARYPGPLFDPSRKIDPIQTIYSVDGLRFHKNLWGVDVIRYVGLRPHAVWGCAPMRRLPSADGHRGACVIVVFLYRSGHVFCVPWISRAGRRPNERCGECTKGHVG
jgi:hypothetical protein